jgi:hypothetical protein
MINMLREWRTRRISKKNIKLLKQGWLYFFDGVAQIDVRCNVGVFEHILDQGCRYLLWA